MEQVVVRGAGNDTQIAFGAFLNNRRRQQTDIVHQESGRQPVGSTTAVTSQDSLGVITAYGSDGTDLATVSSAINFGTYGGISTGQVPGKVVILSAAAGSLKTVAEFYHDGSKSATITTGTTDGVDDNRLIISGGGGTTSIGSDGRGSKITLFGNEGDDLVIFSSDTPGLTIANSNAAGRGSILFADGTTGGERYRGGITYDHGTGVSSSTVADSMYFRTAQAIRLSITGAGNVGIGTQSPTQKLEVSGAGDTWARVVCTSSGNARIRLSAYDTNDHSGIEFERQGTQVGSIRYVHAAAYEDERMEFLTEGNGTVAMVIKTDKVAFGHADPQEILHVKGNMRIMGANGVSGDGEARLRQYQNGGLGCLTFDVGPPGSGIGSSTYNSLFTILSNGNVGIGTTAPQELLHIYNPSTSWNQYATIRMSTDAGDSHAAEIGFHRGTTNDTDRGLFLSGDGSTKHVHILQGGNVGIGTTGPGEKLHVSGNILATGNITAYSDIRFKKNIKTITSPLEKVCAMRGVEYTRIETGEKEIGVIAQEVEKIVPELVSIVNTKSDINTDSFEDVRTMKYGNTVGLLIEAIKEQQKTIDDLKKDIESLKNKIK